MKIVINGAYNLDSPEKNAELLAYMKSFGKMLLTFIEDPNKMLHILRMPECLRDQNFKSIIFETFYRQKSCSAANMRFFWTTTYRSILVKAENTKFQSFVSSMLKCDISLQATYTFTSF